MKNCIVVLLLGLVCFAFCDENAFWMDLESVYTTNISLNDSDCRPSVSRVRKLFYDGNLWNTVIPDAKDYKKPQDAVSVAFQKKYAGDVLVSGAKEDIKHALAALDSYFHPKSVFGRDGNGREGIMNYDLCSWLGDIASALAESHKQNIALEKAFVAYANTLDLKANIAAFRISKLAAPYIQETYKFPISDLFRTHYYSWHNLSERQKFLNEYFASMGLVIEKNSQGIWQFTQASCQDFLKNYTGKVKMAAYAFYFSREDERFPFNDTECQSVLKLFLAEMQKFYSK
ncbi:MAG: hypothetical protein HUU50_19345 [Candidatus Brocadiae bacterium]|nr:hypothetical protein [Candidatus Brocadiia bacterium]